MYSYVIVTEDDSEQPTEGEEEKEAVTYQISNEVEYSFFLFNLYTIISNLS